MDIPKEIKWLQFSDIHIRKCTDYNIMMTLLEGLAGQFHPDFIVVTGDFRHLEYCKDFNTGLEYLKKISEIFRVPKEDFYLVPGNHDTFKVTEPDEAYLHGRATEKILKKSETSTDLSTAEVQYLSKAFEEYREFVKSFYSDTSVTDERISNPTGVMCISRDYLNLILVNTALVSDGKRDHQELLDMGALSTLRLPNGNPSIVLAHHAPDCLSQRQAAAMPILMQKKLHACAYLCGDAHRIAGRWVSEKIVDQKIPFFTCGKSVDDEKDDWSDVCVMGYTWNLPESSVAVQVFEYENGIKDERYEAGFHDKRVYYRGGKPFLFTMEPVSQKFADEYMAKGKEYYDAADYDKALEYYEKARDIRERKLGKDHPDTASLYNNIGIVYNDMGDYDKALEYYEKARVIRERKLGKDHPDTASLYNSIGNVYYYKSDYDKALEYYEKARDIRERKLGKDHPDTARTYNNIGIVYNNKGDYDKALEYHKKAYFIRVTKLVEDHPDTQKSLNRLKDAYRKSGRSRRDFDAWLASQLPPQS